MRPGNENININRVVTLGKPVANPQKPGISTLKTGLNNIKTEEQQDFKDVFKAALENSQAWISSSANMRSGGWRIGR